MRLIRMRYLQSILSFQKTGSLRLTHEGIIIFASAVNNNYEDSFKPLLSSPNAEASVNL
jgi:hypothetical protein